MLSNLRRRLRISSKLPLVFLTLCVVSVSSGCGPGLQVTACVVDTPNNGFQCINSKKKKSYVPFSLGGLLKCASPRDTEDYLKACQQHRVIPIPLCHIHGGDFLCINPDQTQFTQSYESSDNYFCMTDADRKRVQERCFATGTEGLFTKSSI